MKINITIFLLKEGRSKADVLSDGVSPNSITTTIDDYEVDFYWKKQPSEPKWVKLFENHEAISELPLEGVNVQGLLVVEHEQRIFCVCFGHSRHMIDPLSIERYFGLKVALSLSDPELVKSIDKKVIDKIPLQSRMQSSKYVSMSSFDFDFEWQILKSLTGIVEDKEYQSDYEVVSGTDSVSIHTGLSSEDIPSLISRVWKAYKSEDYKTKFPLIDYIVPVRDKAVKEKLNNKIVEAINKEQYSSVWAAPPEIMDYQNFSGFCYKRKPLRSASQPVDPDLDLSRCLKEKKAEQNVNLDWLKSTEIFVYDSNFQEVTRWPLYLCLNGEVKYENNLYLLNEGEWYQVEWNFFNSVTRYFDTFPRSPLYFPPYRGMNERDYLMKVRRVQGFYLMDRKLVRPDGAASSIEFCDLITSKNHLIHVKKYSSSSTLSHLFSQAYVSAETLLREPGIVDQVNEKLKEEGDFRFYFDSGDQPRKVTITFAIMQERDGFLHMPFFSKVNFKQYSMKLRDMGFKVELKKIRYNDSTV